MKKMIIVLMMFVLIFPSSTIAESEYYAKVGVIVDIDRENDLVFFEDFFGEIWSFSDSSDWIVGDVIAVIFDSLNTADIYDDEIVGITYNGWMWSFQTAFFTIQLEASNFLPGDSQIHLTTQ